MVSVRIFVFLCIWALAKTSDASYGTYTLDSLEPFQQEKCCIPISILRTFVDWQCIVEVYFPDTISCQTTRPEHPGNLYPKGDAYVEANMNKINYDYKSFGTEHQGLISFYTTSTVIARDENGCIGKYSLSYTTGLGLVKIIFILTLLSWGGCCVLKFFRKCRTRRRGYIHTDNK